MAFLWRYSGVKALYQQKSSAQFRRQKVHISCIGYKQKNKSKTE